MDFEAVIGLEVHAEMLTRSKMFCGCAVVDSTRAEPNIAVCPVCSGMPGVLPVVNQQAVEYAVRVALALECQVARTSLFARKNYFYPDLPKGYQISQYENPLAEHGRLTITTGAGQRVIRIHRVHLEEDAGKLTHVNQDGQSYSLVDLNRAGVALLEIVSEPDMHSSEEARAYAEELRAVLRALGVNSGDMEKGVIRFEANISVRPVGQVELGTRVEVKNLNSFRALERAIDYQIEKQIALIRAGGKVVQETLGWDEAAGATYSQRSKEEAHDYRYFPEPDLPPLVVEPEWVERVRAALPELPRQKAARLQREYGLSVEEAALLVDDTAVAAYFEQAVAAAPDVPARSLSNWIQGELFAWMKQSGESIEQLRVRPDALAELVALVQRGELNQATGKAVLAEMLTGGQRAAHIVAARGLKQVSDSSVIGGLVQAVLEENPTELAGYLGGKETLSNWFFGQVMRRARGQGNPAVIRQELERQLQARKAG